MKRACVALGVGGLCVVAGVVRVMVRGGCVWSVFRGGVDPARGGRFLFTGLFSRNLRDRKGAEGSGGEVCG